MTYGNTEESRRDRMLQRKMEKLNKKLGPGPNFGGLITDPIPGRLRVLEERMSKIESVLFDPNYVQITRRDLDYIKCSIDELLKLVRNKG